MGKWHLDGFDEHTHYVPPERRSGFDHWMGYDNNNNQEECFVYGTGHETPRRLPGYETDSLTDLLLGHLRRHVNGNGVEGDYQPFFAVLSVQPPHGPMVPPTNPRHGSSVPHQADPSRSGPTSPRRLSFREQAADAAVGYYGMIENLDFNLGRILTALKTLGIDRETYVVFFSDHGDLLGSHGFNGNSLPWEECIRIPFIVGMVGGPVQHAGGQDRCTSQPRGHRPDHARPVRYRGPGANGGIRLLAPLHQAGPTRIPG